MADQKVELKEVYPIPEQARKKAWVSGREAYDCLLYTSPSPRDRG